MTRIRQLASFVTRNICCIQQQITRNYPIHPATYSNILPYFNCLQLRKFGFSVINNRKTVSADITEESTNTDDSSSVKNILMYNFRDENISKFSTDIQCEGDREMDINEWTKIENYVLSADVPKFKTRNWPITFLIYFIQLGHTLRGISLKEYLLNKSNYELPITFLSKFMVLCSKQTNNDQIILETYNLLKTRCPGFDHLTGSDVIDALSCTTAWKNCLTVLDMIRLTSFPNENQYHHIIKAAFKNHELVLGFDLVNKMSEEGGELRSDAIISLLESCTETNNSGYIEQLLQFLKRYEWYPDTRVADLFVEKCNSQSHKRWFAEYSKVNSRNCCGFLFRSRCSSCNQSIQKYHISNETFNELREKYLEKSMVGKDVFQRTNPEELKRFSTFLSNKAPYDVVVDGLNIAFKGHGTLRKITKELVYKFNHKVLVIGRKHMKSHWQRNIERLTDVFYVNNISQDDPFILYGALYSGVNTYIVTSDELRNHRFLLGAKLARVLKSWQRSRQIEMPFQELVFPPKHAVVCQQGNDGSWHIPFDDGKERASYKASNTWICLRRKNV